MRSRGLTARGPPVRNRCADRPRARPERRAGRTPALGVEARRPMLGARGAIGPCSGRGAQQPALRHGAPRHRQEEQRAAALLSCVARLRRRRRRRRRTACGCGRRSMACGGGPRQMAIDTTGRCGTQRRGESMLTGARYARVDSAWRQCAARIPHTYTKSAYPCAPLHEYSSCSCAQRSTYAGKVCLSSESAGLNRSNHGCRYFGPQHNRLSTDALR